MQLLKIVSTENGEVAYLFDGERVLKVFIDDLTRPQAPRRETLPAEEYEVEPPRPRRPVREPIERGEQELVIEGDELVTKPRVETKRRPSIIPPHLRGVFLKPEMRGAAVEQRQV